jgi:hypothetical protein
MNPLAASQHEVSMSWWGVGEMKTLGRCCAPSFIITYFGRNEFTPALISS